MTQPDEQREGVVIIKRGVAECLNGLAALAAAKGQGDGATSLARSARGQFAALGAGIWPADRYDLNRIFKRANLRWDT